MGCVFCATGQMGFARQLTADEIYEQVAIFASELKQQNKRLSNVVMMGMGEPLANYRNVMSAIARMNTDLGIGARKITVSTVGIVPNIKKLMNEDLQVRLAVSLHCSTEEDRTALLPANARYGGLDTLMKTLVEYIETTKRRITLEWALIEGENDTPEVAHQLGQLLQKYNIRSDMVHINVIPLNPTGGFGGSPSGRSRVNAFVQLLADEFNIIATPRMRRGIDIDAGCGQLKASIQKNEAQESTKNELQSFLPKNDSTTSSSIIGVYEDDDDDDDSIISEGKDNFAEEQHLDDNNDELSHVTINTNNDNNQKQIVEFTIDSNAMDFDNDEDDDDDCIVDDFDSEEAERLLELVQLSFPKPSIQTTTTETKTETTSLNTPTVATTSITDEEALKKAKRKRKKLLKQLKAIDKLKQMQNNRSLSQQEIVKISKENEWKLELESIEHNLQ